MAKEVKYYVVDKEKKTITIDKSVKATEGDLDYVKLLLSTGYELREKSAKRAKTASERAKKEKWDNKAIQEFLKDKPDDLETYLGILKGKEEGHGFFKARAWFKEKFVTDDKKKK